MTPSPLLAADLRKSQDASRVLHLSLNGVALCGVTEFVKATQVSLAVCGVCRKKARRGKVKWLDVGEYR